MNILLSLGGLLVVAALASSCCLPSTLSFDFRVDVNVTSQYGDNPTRNFETGMSGSGQYDMKIQNFFLHFTVQDGPYLMSNDIYLDLSGKNKYMVNLDTRGNDSYCSNSEAGYEGTIGKDWQCVLDNKNIFTPISGNQNYQLDIANLASGVVSMQQDNSCHPLGAEARINMTNPYGTEIVNARLSLSNVREKFDQSIFKAPCQAEQRSWGPPGAPKPEFPTPDELVGYILGSKQPRH